jgi:hypothetical protein
MGSIEAENVNHPGYRENLKEEKYTIIREAMLAVLPPPDDADGMSFADLETGVRTHLEERDVPQALFPKPGSIRWYCKAVQLDLEAKKEIERLPDWSPIRLRRMTAGR